MRRSLAVAACLATSLLLGAVPPATAFPLTNCTARVEAHDLAGALYDWVTGGLVDSEMDEPFTVERGAQWRR